MYDYAIIRATKVFSPFIWYIEKQDDHCIEQSHSHNVRFEDSHTRFVLLLTFQMLEGYRYHLQLHFKWHFQHLHECLNLQELSISFYLHNRRQKMNELFLQSYVQLFLSVVHILELFLA